MDKNTYNAIVAFAHADQSTHDFSCHEMTWGEFVELLHGEAAQERHAEMIARKNPVFIPAKFDTEGYDERVVRAEKQYHEDLKHMPPTNGDWWASWVTSDAISELCMWVLDIDSGVSEEQLRAAIGPYEAIYWPTKRSTPAHPRWRVVLLLKRPFVTADYAPADRARVWKRAYLTAAKQLGLDVDTSCTDLCRRCTLPVGKGVVVKHMSGALFDIHSVIDGLEPEQPKQEKNTKARSAKGLPPYWREVLAAIPNSERTVRLQVGMGIHNATSGSDEGKVIWFDWARSGWTNEEEKEREWARFDSEHEGGITWGTVVFLSRQNGWESPKHDVVEWPEADSKGNPVTKSIANVEVAMEHLGLTLFYNEFADRHCIDGGGALEDKHLREMWSNVHRLGLKVEFEFFCRVVITIAERDSRHPVRAYLDRVQVTWDGKPRLDRLLVDYAGAQDTKFNLTAPAMWMKAAVRRVRQPGCKFDNELVLESKEGTGKSTFGNILAGEQWFSDCLPIDAESKVVIEQTRGFWLIEFAELKDIRVKQVENVKAFLSRRVDSARGAYGKMRSDVPRQWVSFGSTNDTTYLMGSTGNRRFWPVAVSRIDLEALRRDRDQLWGEAAVREAVGESIELPEELWAVAAEIQEARRIKLPIEERLGEVLSGVEGIVRAEDLYAAIGLGGNVFQRTATHGTLIKNTMEKLGWKHGRKLLRGAKFTIYRKGESERLYRWDVTQHQFIMSLPPTVDPIEEFAGEPVPENVVSFRPKVAANLN